MAKKRIGFLRIAQETNALSEVPSEIEDFRRTHWKEGPELLAACGRGGTEADGFTKNAELSGFIRAVERFGKSRIEPVPLFSAWAIPGGPLSADALEKFTSLIKSQLRAAEPLDGLFISLHGAMSAEGCTDPESLFLEAAREVIGADVPIAVTLDLHAQITARFIDVADIVCAYRTNPHRDHKRTGRRCGQILIRTVLGEIKPRLAWRSLPMLLGGGNTLDFLQPMRGIFADMNRMERYKSVLYLSIFQCHMWNDHPDAGWSTLAMVDDSQQRAEDLAEQLADACWGVRSEAPPVFPLAPEAISQLKQARWQRKLGTVCLCDASDIVGAGAAGENTRLLEALLEHAPELRGYFPLRDKEVIAKLWHLPEGSSVAESVGGKLHPRWSQPLRVEGTIVRKAESQSFGRQIVLAVGNISLVLTEGAPLAMRPAFYRSLGLNPWKADYVVVKSLFPFRMYFALENRKTIYARTYGATDFDAGTRIPRRHKLHPVEDIEDWRPIDRERRAAATAG